jgi:anthranilate/para-aminobenzoate synthase component I
MIFSSFKWNRNTGLFLSAPIHAYVYYKCKRKNLLTGFEESFSIENYLKEFSLISLEDNLENRVFHFFYELGFLFQGLLDLFHEDDPLVIDICYGKGVFKKNVKSKLKKIKLKSFERPSWGEYKEAFHQIQDHLLQGNAYQVNLTYPYHFFCEEALDPRELNDFLIFNPRASSYAHFTLTGEHAYFSNSPECLFHSENSKMKTLPIKGTIKSTHSFKNDWSTLSKDLKQESELFMIIDLLKNDLNRIEFPRTRVVRPKAPLRVSGLIHQFAEIELSLENRVSCLKVLEALFPGGSITGAPKKRVMEIIHQVERWKRGFYTGSTLLCIGKKKIASINIRSAQIDLPNREWIYGAGGGVTLLSKAAQEFQEMESKVDSFLTVLDSF